MLCVNCGKLLKSGAAFCRYCGAKVVQSQPEQEKKQPADIIKAEYNTEEKSRGISLIKPEDMTEKKAEPIVSEVPLDTEDTAPTQSFNAIRSASAYEGAQENAKSAVPPITSSTNPVFTQSNSYGSPSGYGQQSYPQMNNYPQQNGFGQQGYSQQNNFDQQNYSQPNSYEQQGYKQNSAVKAKGNKKTLIITVSIFATLVLVGTVLALVLRKSEAEKIVSAFNKTLTAKSFKCTGSAYEDRQSIDFSGEILGDGKFDQIYLSIQEDDEDEPEEFAFDGGKMYTKYYDYFDDVNYNQIEDEDIAKALTRLCERDFKEAAKADKDFERQMNRICRNYEEAPEILVKMLNDCIKTKGNVSFVESYKKNGDRYSFDIDLEKFIKAAKKDYGLKLDNDVYDTIRRSECTVDLDIKIEKGYLTELSVDIEADDDEFEATVKFSDFNKIKGENSNAAKLAQEADAYMTTTGISKSKLRSANVNAKTAYNAAAEACADLETQGYRVNWSEYESSWKTASDVPDASMPSGVDKSGIQPFIDYSVAKALIECDESDAQFLIRGEYINGEETFRIFFRKNADDKTIGRYPEAVQSVDEAEVLYDELRHY